MSNYILYRKADSDDIEILAELRVEMLCENKDYETNYEKRLKAELYKNTKQYIKNGFEDGSFISWAAMNTHSKIVAISGLTLYTLPPNEWCPNGRTAYISSLYTLPEYRGKGIARHLIAINIEEAKKNDCQRILLNTTDMGKSLYEQFGFEMSETAMAYFPFGKYSEKLQNLLINKSINQ